MKLHSNLPLGGIKKANEHMCSTLISLDQFGWAMQCWHVTATIQSRNGNHHSLRLLFRDCKRQWKMPCQLASEESTMCVNCQSPRKTCASSQLQLNCWSPRKTNGTTLTSHATINACWHSFLDLSTCCQLRNHPSGIAVQLLVPKKNEWQNTHISCNCQCLLALFH